MINAPMFNDPINKSAFNIYAMRTSLLDEMAKRIVKAARADVERANSESFQHSLRVEFGFAANPMSDEEVKYLQDSVNRLVACGYAI